MNKRSFKATYLLVSLIIGSFSLFGAFIPAYAASAHKATARATCLQPPQNVDLMKLSDVELQSYGLPTHATINADPQKWTTALAHAKHRTCGSTPSKIKRTHRLQPHKTKADEYGSSNWAGNVANSTRGTYRAASVTFNVPSISFSNQSAQVAIWAGVGGDSQYTANPVLVQAGVSTSIVNGSQYNESFFEIEPLFQGERNLPLSRLNAGDEVYAYAESNLNGSGYNYFFIDNLTVTSYNSIYSYDAFSDSAIAECILERPTVNNANVPLLEFNPNAGSLSNTETLTGCEVFTNAGVNAIGNVTHFGSTMYSDDSNRILAYHGPIYDGGYDFLVYWRASS